MGARRRGSQRLCAMGLFCLGLGCEDPRPLVIIEAGPLPAGSQRLRASLTYDSQPAKTPSPLEFDLRAQAAGASVAFGVRLPAQTNADLIVSGGVLDGEGCLTALGVTRTERILDTPMLRLALQETPGSLSRDARCMEPDKTPLILEVRPRRSRSQGGARMFIRGWGFLANPCPQVLVGAAVVPSAAVICSSLSEISLPIPASGGRLGLVPISVTNKNSRETTQGALFGYAATSLRLRPETSYPTLMEPGQLVVGLLDADPLPDVVVGNQSGSGWTVHGNTLGGTFPPARRSAVTFGGRAVGAVMGDVNVDGRTDLVALLPDDSAVATVLQDTPMMGMRLLPPQRSATGILPTGLALGTWVGDAAPDLLVTSQLGRELSLMPGTGSGLFLRTDRREYALLLAPTRVQLHDLTGDQRSEVLSIGTGSSGIAIQVATATGGLADAVYSMAPEVHEIWAADMDGDGDRDVVLWNRKSGKLWLKKNNGQGLLDSGVSELGSVPAGTVAVAVGDLDLDEQADVVVAGSDQTLRVLQNQLDSGTTLRSMTPQAIEGVPTAVALADLNGDGLLDVIVLQSGTNGLGIILNEST